jgi:HD-GYP domain-containing protein (c-di-GMP phosphodiesterase class II)
VAAPLVISDQYHGAVIAFNKIDGEFDSADLKLISSISGQATIFLENRHLYEDVQDLLMGSLHALTASIDAKDPYTCGHSRRVAIVSRKLAQLFGFDEHHAERVYLAGLMHDVGKIGIPEAVLCKPGKLTSSEYKTMQRHPEIGATILSGIRQMEDLIPVILHHHERLDGGGYPAGLSSGEIPIEAMIVGLADSFDAMTSSRTYRNTMPLTAVITEIRRCSGTQFDPRLAELLLSLDLEDVLTQIRTTGTDDPKILCESQNIKMTA